MDPNLILAYNRSNEALSALASAQIFEKQNRPRRESLSMIDQAIGHFHDAKLELLKFREKTYQKCLEEEKALADGEPAAAI